MDGHISLCMQNDIDHWHRSAHQRAANVSGLAETGVTRDDSIGFDGSSVNMYSPLTPTLCRHKVFVVADAGDEVVERVQSPDRP